MAERARQIDPQAVEAAEYLRKNNRVAQAAEVAAFALGGSTNPLAPEEIAQIANDPIQRAVLACLARIYVDSLKTLANQSANPRVAVNSIHEAAGTIGLIYHDNALHDSLRGVSQDHRGRQHHFSAEMPRDEAKTCFAAADIFPRQVGAELVLAGEEILRKTYQELPDNHPTKALIGIELSLSILSRGGVIDNVTMLKDFDALVKSDEKTNPHRVATVASWMVVWGRRTSNIEMNTKGNEVFNRLIQEHPEWTFMTEDEERKIARKSLRRTLLRLSAPLMLDQHGKRQEIKKVLLY